MTRTGGGLHSVDTEGLCQLSDDVMIYFEEVMSGFCSEAAVGDARTYWPYGRIGFCFCFFAMMEDGGGRGDNMCELLSSM